MDDGQNSFAILIDSMAEARAAIKQWLNEHNTIRAHGSLNGMNPEALENTSRVNGPKFLERKLPENGKHTECFYLSGSWQHRILTGLQTVRRGYV